MRKPMPTKRDPRAPCRPEAPPSLHERLIRDLIANDPKMCRNGFWRAVRDIAEEVGLSDDEWLSDRDFQPDAYLIDREAQVVRIYEVEVTSPLSEKKLFDYAWFWFLWECEGDTEWIPKLYTVDRYGNCNELSLQGLYYSRIMAPHMPESVE
jgi:hypothetical protein